MNNVQRMYIYLIDEIFFISKIQDLGENKMEEELDIITEEQESGVVWEEDNTVEDDVVEVETEMPQEEDRVEESVVENKTENVDIVIPEKGNISISSDIYKLEDGNLTKLIKDIEIVVSMIINVSQLDIDDVNKLVTDIKWVCEDVQVESDGYSWLLVNIPYDSTGENFHDRRKRVIDGTEMYVNRIVNLTYDLIDGLNEPVLLKDIKISMNARVTLDNTSNEKSEYGYGVISKSDIAVDALKYKLRYSSPVTPSMHGLPNRKDHRKIMSELTDKEEIMIAPFINNLSIMEYDIIKYVNKGERLHLPNITFNRIDIASEIPNRSILKIIWDRKSSNKIKFVSIGLMKLKMTNNMNRTDKAKVIFENYVSDRGIGRSLMENINELTRGPNYKK